MTLFNLKQDIMQMAELGALAVLRIQSPVADEVNLTEAYKIAGYQWLKHHIKEGNIKPTRRGTAKNSPIFFSRLEIAALKKAEQTSISFLNNKTKTNGTN